MTTVFRKQIPTENCACRVAVLLETAAAQFEKGNAGKAKSLVKTVGDIYRPYEYELYYRIWKKAGSPTHHLTFGEAALHDQDGQSTTLRNKVEVLRDYAAHLSHVWEGHVNVVAPDGRFVPVTYTETDDEGYARDSRPIVAPANETASDCADALRAIPDFDYKKYGFIFRGRVFVDSNNTGNVRIAKSS